MAFGNFFIRVNLLFGFSDNQYTYKVISLLSNFSDIRNLHKINNYICQVNL